MKSSLVRGGLITAVVVLLAAVPGLAAPTATISALGATVTATAVAVTGKAVFSGDPVAVVTDNAGDATQKGVGADIKGGSIQLAANGRDLVFTFEIADQLAAPVGASPSVVYNWPLAVNGNDTGLFLSAGRAGIYGISPNGTDPVFALLQNGDEGFTNVAQLTGKIADGVVQWTLPISQIGAAPGSVIGVGGSTAAGSTLGVEGVVYFNANFGGDAVMTDDYTVPGTVALGIGPSTTPVEEIVVATPATTKSNGTFSGLLPLPAEAGTYTVVAKACADDVTCTVSTTTITR